MQGIEMASADPAKQHEYLTTKQLAALFQLSPKTIEKHRAKVDGIPGQIKVFGEWRFHLPTLMRAALSGKLQIRGARVPEKN